jgi:hypothetical protein
VAAGPFLIEYHIVDYSAYYQKYRVTIHKAATATLSHISHVHVRLSSDRSGDKSSA